MALAALDELVVVSQSRLRRRHAGGMSWASAAGMYILASDEYGITASFTANGGCVVNGGCDAE